MRCLQCGKEIPEGRKFCSSSCSAKYNNVRRQRKPWTEEQKQRIRRPRKEVVCKYCGKPGKSVCDECRPYIHLQKFVQRLGETEGSLKQRYEKAEESLKNMYLDEKLSTVEIYRKTGISSGEISKYLRRAGIVPRTSLNGQMLAISLGKKRIPEVRDFENFKGIVHRTWFGDDVYLRSSYEKDFAEELDSKKIHYQVEPFQVVYSSSRDGSIHRALPDFYLPETGEIVEIKSYYTLKGKVEEMKDKFREYRNRGYTPKLILEHKEVDIQQITEKTLRSI